MPIAAAAAAAGDYVPSIKPCLTGDLLALLFLAPSFAPSSFPFQLRLETLYMSIAAAAEGGYVPSMTPCPTGDLLALLFLAPSFAPSSFPFLPALMSLGMAAGLPHTGSKSISSSGMKGGGRAAIFFFKQGLLSHLPTPFNPSPVHPGAQPPSTNGIRCPLAPPPPSPLPPPPPPLFPFFFLSPGIPDSSPGDPGLRNFSCKLYACFIFDPFVDHSSRIGG